VSFLARTPPVDTKTGPLFLLEYGRFFFFLAFPLKDLQKALRQIRGRLPASF